MSPFLIKDDGEVLTDEFTKPLRSIWQTKWIINDWCESKIAPTHKKGDRPFCANHAQSSFVADASKPLIIANTCNGRRFTMNFQRTSHPVSTTHVQVRIEEPLHSCFILIKNH